VIVSSWVRAAKNQEAQRQSPWSVDNHDTAAILTEVTATGAQKCCKSNTMDGSGDRNVCKSLGWQQ